MRCAPRRWQKGSSTPKSALYRLSSRHCDSSAVLITKRRALSCIIEEAHEHAFDVREHHRKCMKTGIIGLPQVGKTSLFKILTKAKLEERGYSNPREAHIGVARVPDERLEKLSALYSPKKTTFATVEYVDVA